MVKILYIRVFRSFIFAFPRDNIFVNFLCRGNEMSNIFALPRDNFQKKKITHENANVVNNIFSTSSLVNRNNKLTSDAQFPSDMYLTLLVRCISVVFYQIRPWRFQSGTYLIFSKSHSHSSVHFNKYVTDVFHKL